MRKKPGLFGNIINFIEINGHHPDPVIKPMAERGVPDMRNPAGIE
jgi:hypothetical protein